MDTVPQSQPLEVEIDLPVRTYDIDFAGVVSNIVYVRWLEDLRLEMLARYFPLGEQLQKRIAPAIVQTKINYKQPIKISDFPKGKMWVEAMESLRWTVNAEIVVNGKVAALGQQVGIFIDLQNNKPIRMPEGLQQKYRESLAQASQ
jgi:acyl-CoA thioester hydrolase